MMDEEHVPAASHRLIKLALEFRDKEFRDTYVAAHTRRFLARQMRKFRGKLSQMEFAEQLGKQQTIVSRLENPHYSGWTLGTLLEISSKLNIGVIVKFVDFSTFLKYTGNLSETALNPAAYDQQQVEDSAQSEAEREFQEAEFLRPLTDEPAKEDAKQAQRKSAETGLFPPERPENKWFGADEKWPMKKNHPIGAGIPL